MRLLHQQLYTHLPDWAQPHNAVLRYVRPCVRLHSRWPGRWFALFGGGVSVVTLVTISWLAYAAGTPLAASRASGSAVFAVLYSPLLILQLVTLMVALLWGLNGVSLVQQRGGWEVLKVTSHGLEKLIFARWAAMFYQTRALLVLLMVPRVLFAGLALVSLTEYRGYYLDLYAMGGRSEVPVGVAVFMLAALLTAALVQFPVLMGLNTAIGLLISTAFPKRAIAGVARAVVFAGEIGLFWLAFCALQSMLDTSPGSYPIEQTAKQWIDLLLLGSLGDQGLRFMDLQTFLQTWPDVAYSPLLGAILLAVVIGQILVTRGVLAVTARLATRSLPE